MRCRTIKKSRQVGIVKKDLYIFFAFSAILMERLGKTMIMFVRLVHIVPEVRIRYYESKSVVCYYYLYKSLVNLMFF